MDTNGREYVENELCYRVTGCAMAVLNDVGHGLREKTYERGLYVEFEEQGLHTIRSMFIPFFIKVGIILNFKHAKLEWKKVVLTNDQ